MTDEIMKTNGDLYFNWKDYAAIEPSIVESFLDKDAVNNSGSSHKQSKSCHFPEQYSKPKSL